MGDIAVNIDSQSFRLFLLSRKFMACKHITCNTIVVTEFGDSSRKVNISVLGDCAGLDLGVGNKVGLVSTLMMDSMSTFIELFSN